MGKSSMLPGAPCRLVVPCSIPVLQLTCLQGLHAGRHQARWLQRHRFAAAAASEERALTADGA